MAMPPNCGWWRSKALREVAKARLAGALAYETMFNVVRRQLLQGLNVICDSPLA
jgi:hypothetical protein